MGLSSIFGNSSNSASKSYTYEQQMSADGGATVIRDQSVKKKVTQTKTTQTIGSNNKISNTLAVQGLKASGDINLTINDGNDQATEDLVNAIAAGFKSTGESIAGAVQPIVVSAGGLGSAPASPSAPAPSSTTSGQSWLVYALLAAVVSWLVFKTLK